MCFPFAILLKVIASKHFNDDLARLLYISKKINLQMRKKRDLQYILLLKNSEYVILCVKPWFKIKHYDCHHHN